MKRVETLVVLGGGSAGFLAALTVKLKRPAIRVVVVRSPDLGIIGVGEGSIPYVPEHLHGYLRRDLGPFFAATRPVWKLGIRFLWGPRTAFNYSFTYQFDQQVPGLPKRAGFYCFDDLDDADSVAALMARGRVFARGPSGLPLFHNRFAYHLENETFVGYLEAESRSAGVEVVDGTLARVRQGEDGVEALVLESGAEIAGDLFVDASGFRSELLGKLFAEPFESFASTLFCDRAIVGGWARGSDEPILPYTTAETMNAGWCWRIDHENRINRGYVFSSAFLSDSEAEAEFRAANPKVGPTRIVKFTSGRRRRSWVKNVVGIGNASGFVEPLESTSLYVICAAAQSLAEILKESPAPGPEMARQYDRYVTGLWDRIRRFLAVHYRYNTRLATPFWRECQEKVDLAGADEIVAYYQENGPSTLWKPTLMDGLDPFELEGYWALLLGQAVPHRRLEPIPGEAAFVWQQRRWAHAMQADTGYTPEEALALVHNPAWTWNRDWYS